MSLFGLWTAGNWPCPPPASPTTTQAALEDLDRAQELDPWNEDVLTGRTAVLAAKREAAISTDRILAAKMFRS